MPDAVEPCWVVGPIQIAEMERVSGQGVRLQGKPRRTDEVRASCNHDRLAAGPGNGEAKGIGFRVLTRLHSWQPESGRPSSQLSFPTSRAWQIVRGELAGKCGHI